MNHCKYIYDIICIQKERVGPWEKGKYNLGVGKIYYYRFLRERSKRKQTTTKLSIINGNEDFYLFGFLLNSRLAWCEFIILYEE